MTRGRFFVLALAATLVVGWPLLAPWTYETHDGHYAFYNLAGFSRALGDGQLPVRWIPDLYGGRGLPVFLYYHPLVFYLGALLAAAGLPAIAAVKATYLLSLFASACTMRAWLLRHLDAEAAAVGAVAYVLAPIRVIEVHVKGDPPAALAFVFLPLVLLAADRIRARERHGVTLFALSSAGLVLSHSVTALVALPLILLYCLLTGEARLLFLARLAAGAVLGAGLSCFHWLPALRERDLVYLDHPLGILAFDWREHFVEAWQWLSPSWGYHGSAPGPLDDMSFQIGPVHVVGLLAGLGLWRQRLARFALAGAAVCLLLMLAIGRPVWEALPALRFVQFPWRFLAPLALASASLLAIAASSKRMLTAAALAPALLALAFAATTGSRRYALLAACHLAAAGAAWAVRRRGMPGSLVLAGVLAATALPWSAVPLHARWMGAPPVIAIGPADLAPENVRKGFRRTTARDEYLPRTVDPATIPPRSLAAEFVAAAGEAAPASAGFRRDSRSWEGTVSGPDPVTLELHDFPGWAARLDGRPIAHRHDAHGRIVIDAPAGRHRLELVLERTPVRRSADRVSLLSALLLSSLAAARSRRR